MLTGAVVGCSFAAMTTTMPVGTVLYRSYDTPGVFDVAVHTNTGWTITDQCGTYPLTGAPRTASEWERLA